jgi:glycosyltransferase involved in cell wall biosynthesis
MKIVAVLEDDVLHGGGFSQAVSAILQMRRLADQRFGFEVVTDRKANLTVLGRLGIQSSLVRFALLDRLLGSLSTSTAWHSLQVRLRLTGPFERSLLAGGCDLVYFLRPSRRAAGLQRLNYIATVWDLCHRDALEFPEVRQYGDFQARERLYRSTLAPAVFVLTDSSVLADNAAHWYGLDRDRLMAMPFSVSPFMEAGSSAGKAAVLERYHLDEGYFFYPAQFWAHKNHVRAVQALALLRRRDPSAQLVFAGGDQGNQGNVERLVEASELRDRVRFLGFVPAEHMRGLYQGARALVMPSYFGPTNIPPLEAWSVGTPVIYSAQFKEQVGSAAICIDPDSADDLAAAMAEIGRNEVRAQLLRHGEARLRELERMRESAEAELLVRLQRFAARRSCWQ